MALHGPSFDRKILGCLDDWLQSLVDSETLPFVQILITRGGDVEHRFTACDPNTHGGALKSDSLFRIYSMTKPMTALGMMILYERGLWRPSDELTEILPEFAKMGKLEGNAETGLRVKECETPIILKHLLTHTAGLSHGLDPMGFTNPLDPMYHGKTELPYSPLAREEVWKPEDNTAGEEKRPSSSPPPVAGPAAPDMTLEEWVKALAQYPLLEEPGTEFRYSFSIDVLGRVIEVLSRMPLDEFFQKEILDPLGMKDTFFRIPEDQVERLVPNYAPHNSGKGLHDITIPTTRRYLMGSRAPLSGGSGLISTVKDYWKFAELLRGRGRCPHTGIRLIGPKTYEFMVSNHLPGGQSMHDLTNNPLVRRMTLDGMGMGFGVSVLTDPVAAGVNASEGIIHWGGAASTLFWVDGAEDLQCLFFTQNMIPDSLPFLTRLLQFVYSALNQSRKRSQL